MRKTLTVKLAMTLGVSAALSAFGQNLLVNGSFQMGNRSFTNTYSYSPSNLWNTASFDVVTNPHDDHRLGASFGDHTPGAGYMLALNGSSDTNAVVWSETVPVSPDTTYVFSGWGASWGEIGHGSDPSPAALRILINGQQSAADVRLAATDGLWQNYTVVWHSQIGIIVSRSRSFEGCRNKPVRRLSAGCLFVALDLWIFWWMDSSSPVHLTA